MLDVAAADDSPSSMTIRCRSTAAVVGDVVLNCVYVGKLLLPPLHSWFRRFIYQFW